MYKSRNPSFKEFPESDDIYFDPFFVLFIFQINQWLQPELCNCGSTCVMKSACKEVRYTEVMWLGLGALR